jgi:hypothetical protein
MEPIGALTREVVDANSLKDMVGPCGLEPQTSTVSTAFCAVLGHNNASQCRSRDFSELFSLVLLTLRAFRRLRRRSIARCRRPRLRCRIIYCVRDERAFLRFLSVDDNTVPNL